MNLVEIEQMTSREPILKKLIYGIGVIPERIKITNGTPFLINNDNTPVHPTYGKTIITPSNGNAADNAIDAKLAILFGDEKQKPVVRGANQTGMSLVGEHYVLKNGLVYVVHIFGPTGNEFIDIYSPVEFEKPVLSPNANPKDSGYFGLFCTNKKMEPFSGSRISTAFNHKLITKRRFRSLVRKIAWLLRFSWICPNESIALDMFFAKIYNL